ncbi:MAG: hypothetical protein OHK0046_31180 [Anaerolineae bacterium]
MRLTVTAHSFEHLPLDGALSLVHHLGFRGVDMSGFHARGRLGFEPQDILTDTPGQAERLNQALEKYGLECVDFFPQFGTAPELQSINDPDPDIRAQTLDFIRACAEFCQRTHTTGMTILPGVVHEGRTFEENFQLAGEMLNRASEITADYGVQLRFEPHMGSLLSTPELTIRLIDTYAPNVRVTLDYAHFLLQYVPVERIHALLPYAGHFHLRPARPGKLQTRHIEGTLDWDDILTRLKATGYNGAVSIEYVCMAWYDCNQLDTITETLTTKEALEPLFERL